MGERTLDVQDNDLGEILEELAAIIKERREADPQKSYTAKLLTQHEDMLYKKLVEEATELVMASKDRDHDHIRYEAADLLYHLLVMLERTGVSTHELAGELKARMG